MEREAIGEILLQLVDVAVLLLHEPLDALLPARALLSKLFLCVPDCTYFLNTYGAIAQVRCAAAPAQPRVFVACMLSLACARLA